MNQSQSVAQSITVKSRPAQWEIQVIPEDLRMNFLPRHFGSHYLKFENALYAIATKTIKGYKGGYWEFAVTQSGAGFVFPKTGNDEMVSVATIFGHNESQLPAVLAGIVTTALTLSNMMNNRDQYRLSEDAVERMVDHYMDLMSSGHQIADKTGYRQEFFNLTD